MIPNPMETLTSCHKAASSYVDDLAEDSRGILAEVRLIGAALVLILVMVLVLTEVWEAIDPAETDGTYDGPFGEVFGSLEGVGVAALTLMVVATLVLAASAIMRYFSGGFGSR